MCSAQPPPHHCSQQLHFKLQRRQLATSSFRKRVSSLVRVSQHDAARARTARIARTKPAFIILLAGGASATAIVREQNASRCPSQNSLPRFSRSFRSLTAHKRSKYLHSLTCEWPRRAITCTSRYSTSSGFQRCATAGTEACERSTTLGPALQEDPRRIAHCR